MNTSKLVCFYHLLSFFLFATFSFKTVSSTAATLLSYIDYCAPFIPESTVTKPGNTRALPYIPLHTGYYTVKDMILEGSPRPNIKHSVCLDIDVVRETDTDGLFAIEGRLVFGNGAVFQQKVNNVGSVGFKLHGLWSEVAGNVCMVGTSFLHGRNGNWINFDAILKLGNVLDTSMVTGILESLSSGDDGSSFFEPISVFLFRPLNHRY